MADPTMISTPVDTWTLVATATTLCNIEKRRGGFKYYYTTRDTAGAAPSAPGAVIPEEAVELDRDRDIVLTNADADVYVLCKVEDSVIAGASDGQVRVQA